MKFTAVVVAVVAAVAGVNAAAESSLHVHIRVHEHHAKQSGICYEKCKAGQYCAINTKTCRGPTPNTTECFNPATSQWMTKCDAGFTCSEGKCVVGGTNESGAAKDKICYAKCDKGQYCAVNTTTCRRPKNANECFNRATSRWIDKCAAGFKCVDGACAKA